MRILAIDDNDDNLVSVAALLRTFLPGCEVETARSGHEGLERARSFRPDTILLDIQMPGMDGYETCRRLKSDLATRHVPVVFLTAHDTSAASRVRGLETGGDAFLAKPVEPAELTAQVRAMARIKRAEDALRDEKRSLQLAVIERTEELERSRALLQAVVEGTTDLVIVKDAAGGYVLANGAALAFWGKKREEVLGREVRDVLPAAAAEVVRETERRVLAGSSPQTFEEIITVGGETRVFLSTKGAIRDASGRATGLFSIARDITERKRLEEALAESEGRVTLLLDHMPVAAFLRDAEGRTVFANAAAKELSSGTELVGREEEEDDRAVLAGGKVVRERSIVDAQGRVHRLRTHLFPITQASGATLVGGISIELGEGSPAPGRIEG